MVTTQIYTTHSSEETQQLAHRFAASLKAGVICLYGELGSGKTTFTQGLGKSLGIKERIISPTYTLVREYDLPSGSKFYHLDLYRTDGNEKLIDFDINNSIVLVEWADRMKDSLPKIRIDIFFETNSNGTHTMKVYDYTTH